MEFSNRKREFNKHLESVEVWVSRRPGYGSSKNFDARLLDVVLVCKKHHLIVLNNYGFGLVFVKHLSITVFMRDRPLASLTEVIVNTFATICCANSTRHGTAHELQSFLPGN